MRCRCGGSQVETDAASGTTFCVACGEVISYSGIIPFNVCISQVGSNNQVLEENSIVAEVTFQEVAGGKTVLQGTFAGESGMYGISEFT